MVTTSNLLILISRHTTFKISRPNYRPRHNKKHNLMSFFLRMSLKCFSREAIPLNAPLFTPGWYFLFSGKLIVYGWVIKWRQFRARCYYIIRRDLTRSEVQRHSLSPFLRRRISGTHLLIVSLQAYKKIRDTGKRYGEYMEGTTRGGKRYSAWFELVERRRLSGGWNGWRRRRRHIQAPTWIHLHLSALGNSQYKSPSQYKPPRVSNKRPVRAIGRVKDNEVALRDFTSSWFPWVEGWDQFCSIGVCVGFGGKCPCTGGG